MPSPFSGSSVNRPVRLAQTSREQRLHACVAVGFSLLALFAFARSYYFRWLVAAPPMPLALHVHAFVMSGWVGLLLVQSALIARHRVAWHRRLGMCGAAWAVLVFIVGIATTLNASVREVHAHSPD